jgi:hypothetical protein
MKYRGVKSVMLHDIFSAVLAWLVPVIGVYILSLIPKVREIITKNPVASAISISWILTMAALVSYDQFILLGGRQAPARESCPVGQVVVGINFNVDSGGPHGIISAVSPVCQSISIFHQ